MNFFLPIYQVLSEDQVRTIHDHTLDILKNTGIAVQHKQALETLSESGAVVDFVNQRVRFSPELVERSLEEIPREFVCAGRDPRFDFRVAFDAPPICRCTAGAVNLLDLTTNKSRPVTLADCRDIAHIIDGLENTTFSATQVPRDVPLPVYDIQALKVMLESGRKHIWALVNSSVNLAYQIEMMVAVCGSETVLAERPICHGIVTVLEQFKFTHDEIERLLLYGRYKIPVKVPIAPMMGANAPTTVAGTMVQANAEAVASAVLIHCLCPGTPTWYYFFIQAMDKRTGGNIFMSPEIVLCSLGLIQMARHYQMPAAPSSFETNGARLSDVVYGNGVSVSLFALAGAFENASTGCVDMSLGVSKQGLIIGDEIWGHTRRLLAGFCDEADAFALDAIKRVSEGSGHYLTDDHTIKYLRLETQFAPDIISYRSYKNWCDSPKSLAEEAQERVTELIKNHSVPPLDENVQKELNLIAQAASKRLLNK
ncbi:MAG: trimethylamine methyltransferase family protein [Desulfobacterales bacterium]|jgi:trimethylamine--corrinoid protein Co-methyltransferase